MRVIALLVITVLSALAQSPTVIVSDADSRESYTVHYEYDASDNLEYVCKTRSNAATTTTFSVDASTLTSLVDSSNTATGTTAAAHYLLPGNSITISGETGDTDLNGTYVIATVPSSTTFTITTASVTDATYNASGLQFTTTAPLLSSSIWSVRRFVYDSSDNLTQTVWADGNTQMDNACSSPSSLSFY